MRPLSESIRRYTTSARFPDELRDKIAKSFFELRAIGKLRQVPDLEASKRFAKNFMQHLQNAAPTDTASAELLRKIETFRDDPKNTATVFRNLPIKGEEDEVISSHIVTGLAAIFEHKLFSDEIIAPINKVDSKSYSGFIPPHCDQPLSKPKMSMIVLATLEGGSEEKKEEVIGTLIFDADEVYSKLSPMAKEIFANVDFRCKTRESDTWHKIFSFDKDGVLQIDFDTDDRDLDYDRKTPYPWKDIRDSVAELSDLLFNLDREEVGGMKGSATFIKNHRAMHGRREVHGSRRLLVRSAFEKETPSTDIELEDEMVVEKLARFKDNTIST